MNLSKTDDERRYCKKYSLTVAARDAMINIPPEYDRPDLFLPSLGPKVNHHFRKNNSEYYLMDHPRWGAIQGVVTTKDVKAGEELFTHYGYEPDDFPNDFPWYWELKRNIEKEERQAEKYL